MTRGNGKRGASRRAPQAMLVAPNNDTVAVRVDRTIAAMRAQESSFPFLAKSYSAFNSSTTATSGTIGFPTILGNEDVASLAAQFTEVKIKAIRYDIYHAGVSGGSAVFGTYHTNGNLPPVGYEDVIDSEDSQVLNSGGERQQFYWQANGPLEGVYQRLSGFVDFGGLRYNIPAQTSAGNTLFTIVVSAVVIFRGRT